MLRLFLDANVLFSAAYRADAGLLRLWTQKDLTLVTSAYALEEARRNLDRPDQRERLDRLAQRLEVVPTHTDLDLPPAIALPDKDRPILQAAIASRCHYLLTGDLRHFRPLLGKKTAGVIIMTPGDFLRKRP